MSHFTTYSIYCITCLSTSQKYVGLSKSPKRRKQQHFTLLEKGRHNNRLLQVAYSEHGKDGFVFRVIETGVSPAKIAGREKYWIRRFESHGKGFNLSGGGEVDLSGIPLNVDRPIEYIEEFRKSTGREINSDTIRDTEKPLNTWGVVDIIETIIADHEADGLYWCNFGSHWKPAQAFDRAVHEVYPIRGDFCRECRDIQIEKLRIAKELLKQSN